VEAPQALLLKIYCPSVFAQAVDIPQRSDCPDVVAANNKVEATVRRREGLGDERKLMLQNRIEDR